jgi:hypothetical protein
LSVVLRLSASDVIVVESITSTSIAYVKSVAPTTQLPHCCLCSCREFLHSLNNVVNSLLYWNSSVCPKKVISKKMSATAPL